MYRQRTFRCEDCGDLVTRNRHSISVRVCFDCGVKRSIASIRQLHAREGPYYDRWLAAVTRTRRAPSKTGGSQ